jgi:hypothetical protein
MICYAVLCYAVLCYAMLCCAVLRCAQVCLRADGVSIPCRYTSFLSLVSAPRLWTCVQEMPDRKVGHCTAATLLLHYYYRIGTYAIRVDSVV